MKRPAAALLVVFLCLCSGRSLVAQNSKSDLKSLSTESILDCLSHEGKCSQDSYELRDELLRRRPVFATISAYKRAPQTTDGALLHDLIKELLYFMARDRHDVRIDKFMRRELNESTEHGSYYNALYLAHEGDLKSLAILNKNCWKYGISSAEWADALDEFGRNRYRPAIPCLVESANAASLNAADAAYRSLLKFYPDAPKDLPSPEAAEQYFKSRYAKDGHRRRPS